VQQSAKENKGCFAGAGLAGRTGWHGRVNYIEANNTQRLDNGSSDWSLHIDEAAASQLADVAATAALKTWPFRDVTDSTTWYYSAVQYVYARELVQGVSATQFAPCAILNRAMLVTVLNRLAGTPPAAGANPFADVAAGSWYANAVIWAAENNLAGGDAATNFGPNEPVTREQLVAWLYQYAVYQGYDVSVGLDTNILSYEDAFDIAEYAIPAMQWACGAGVIEGRTESALVPQGAVTRAELSAILMRFVERVMV